MYSFNNDYLRPVVVVVFTTLLGALVGQSSSIPRGGKEAKPQAAKAMRSFLSPQQEHATFRLAPGLRMELVACEPRIQSPVAMMFDEDGKLWVVEMRDYPNGPAKGQLPQGRIITLEDRDGDGRYERRRVFADNLLFANGLLRWRDGVIVTQAPNIVFLRDTDGDGKADRREIWYEGFAEQNPQLRVSHPNLGIDNWIYVANGLRGGQVRKAGTKNAKPINLSGMDFRFDPISSRHEAITGMGQFGNTFDAHGRRFVCDNRHHLRHVVLPNRYLKRNPHLAVSKVLDDISVLDDGPLSSGGKVYPLSKNWTTSNLHAGRFTAACGVFVYRGGVLPASFTGNVFTCDPTGNLVHREIMKEKGASLESRPARKGIEFFATPNDWCRPVFLADGPDGALYMVDMYRAVIEHPQFMPPELKQRPDLELGKDKGRIWRIVPEKHKTASRKLQLSKATTAELVQLLEHPFAWQRGTGQRLLLQRQDKSAIPLLRRLALSQKDVRGRLLAIGLLASFQAIDESRLLSLLKDNSAHVREQAARLAAEKIATSTRLQKQVSSMANDPEPRVRFQVALTIGEWNDDGVLRPLAEIARRDAGDEWTRYAVATAIPNRAGELLTRVWKQATTKDTESGHKALVQELAILVGTRRDVDEMQAVLETIFEKSKFPNTSLQMLVLQNLADSMVRRGTRFQVFLKSLPKTSQPFVNQTLTKLAESAKIAPDKRKPLAIRLNAIRLLSHTSWATAKPTLQQLMKHDHPQPIRLAAVRSLSDHNHSDVAPLLLKEWPRYGPTMRSVVTSALLRRTDRIKVLFQELQTGRVKPGDIDAVSTRRLLRHRTVAIRRQAVKLLQANIPAARKKVLTDYVKALKLKGNAHRGQPIFKKNCATCHRIGNLGIDVGPVISDTRTKTAAALLNDILNPNQAIDNNYVNYLVVTNAGKTLTGIIVTETASSITLKRASNETDVVLRQDIAEISSSGVSLMPEGLEKNITVPEMADLLAYLKNWRYLDGGVPNIAK